MRDSVWGAQFSRGRDDPREFAERPEQRGIGQVIEQVGVELVQSDAGARRIASYVARPRVRALHVVHRVVVAVLDEQIEVYVEHRVGARPFECIAGRVDADGVDRSSSVTTLPARFPIRTGRPSLTRLTNCPISTSTALGSSWSAAAAAFSRPMYPWWSAPSM